MSRTFQLKCVASVWQAPVVGAGASLGMPAHGDTMGCPRRELPQRPEKAE